MAKKTRTVSILKDRWQGEDFSLQEYGRFSYENNFLTSSENFYNSKTKAICYMM